jgi:hypothetical protein
METHHQPFDSYDLLTGPDLTHGIGPQPSLGFSLCDRPDRKISWSLVAIHRPGRPSFPGRLRYIQLLPRKIKTQRCMN